MYEHDERIVMTLDAGGTNFVFSAIQGCREIVEPICLPAASDDLERCLSVLVEGFLEVEKRLPRLPVAISFAFPGLLTMSMELLVTCPTSRPSGEERHLDLI